jgi:hypothetical protein
MPNPCRLPNAPNEKQAILSLEKQRAEARNFTVAQIILTVILSPTLSRLIRIARNADISLWKKMTKKAVRRSFV